MASRPVSKRKAGTEEVHVVTPGERLGHASELTAGEGTYERGRHIYASVVGVPKIVNKDKKTIIEIAKRHKDTTIPELGKQVVVKVTNVTPRQANVQIMCVDGKCLAEPSPDVIRQQDVRAYDVDKVDMYRSFRPGDIVKAEVMSLGDSRSYTLSTSKNELGVIIARSIAGAPMVPISWQEMCCTATKTREYRKVAKVI